MDIKLLKAEGNIWRGSLVSWRVLGFVAASLEGPFLGTLGKIQMMLIYASQLGVLNAISTGLQNLGDRRLLKISYYRALKMPRFFSMIFSVDRWSTKLFKNKNRGNLKRNSWHLKCYSFHYVTVVLSTLYWFLLLLDIHFLLYYARWKKSIEYGQE